MRAIVRLTILFLCGLHVGEIRLADLTVSSGALAYIGAIGVFAGYVQRVDRFKHHLFAVNLLLFNTFIS